MIFYFFDFITEYKQRKTQSKIKMNTKSYAKRMLEEHPELEYDTYTLPRIAYIVNNLHEDDFLHEYMHFLYKYTTHKELNQLCKYLKIKGKQNKCKGEKITFITQKLANNQLNPQLLDNFEHLYCAYYIQGGSWGEFVDFMKEFNYYMIAFSERYPVE